MQAERFKGIMSALITPLKAGKTDFESLGKLIELLNPYSHSVLVGGTTGEGPLLPESELIKIVGFCAEKSSLPLIAAAIKPSTHETIAQVKKLEQTKAQALLVSPPFYFTFSQEELFRHFQAVAEAASLPIIIYMNTFNSHNHVEFETLKRLAELPQIIGVKESTKQKEVFIKQTIPFFQEKGKLAFEALEPFYFQARKADGFISVVNALDPKLFFDFFESRLSEDLKKLEEMQARFNLLNEVCEVVKRPDGWLIGLKEALFQRGVIASPELSAPLQGCSAEEKKRIKEVLSSIASS